MKDECDNYIDNITKQKRFDEIQQTIDLEKEEKLKKERTNNIIKTKNQHIAAICIQNWWKKKLYEPGKGIFYKQSKSSFENND